jgi:hypothetical protein
MGCRMRLPTRVARPSSVQLCAALCACNSGSLPWPFNVCGRQHADVCLLPCLSLWILSGPGCLPSIRWYLLSRGPNRCYHVYAKKTTTKVHTITWYTYARIRRCAYTNMPQLTLRHRRTCYYAANVASIASNWKGGQSNVPDIASSCMPQGSQPCGAGCSWRRDGSRYPGIPAGRRLGALQTLRTRPAGCQAPQV